MDGAALWKILGAAAAAVAGVAVLSNVPDEDMGMRARRHGADEFGTGCALHGGEGVCGLTNLGNTCFANSVLQALASVPRFGAYLHTVEDRLAPSACVASAVQVLDRLSDGHGGVASPRRLVAALRREARQFAVPQHHDASEFFHFLLDRVQVLTEATHAAASRGGRGGDSGSSVVASMTAVLRPATRPSLRGGHAATGVAVGGGGGGGGGNPLVGTLASSVVCDECGHRFALRVSPFADVSVPIPSATRSQPSTPTTAALPAGQPVALEHCLAAFCESERVEGVVCERCCVKETLGEVDRVLFHALRADRVATDEHIDVDALVECQDVLRGMLAGDDFDYVRPQHPHEIASLPVRRKDTRFAPPERLLKTRGAVHKSLTITNAPPVLAIHIRRIVTTMHGHVYKVRTHVAFPRRLDVAPFCTFGRATAAAPAHTYELRSVVVHHGAGVQHGHYTAYRRVPRNESSATGHTDSDEWVHISDEAVTRCSWATVARAEAFLLFYARA